MWGRGKSSTVTVDSPGLASLLRREDGQARAEWSMRDMTGHRSAYRARDCPAFLMNMVETLPANGHLDTDCTVNAPNTILDTNP